MQYLHVSDNRETFPPIYSESILPVSMIRQTFLPRKFPLYGMRFRDGPVMGGHVMSPRVMFARLYLYKGSYKTWTGFWTGLLGLRSVQ